mmetsp:Transcript_11451/g.22753  ORF Transcript_11451/g.22753 Transcript_11451/m.22753 type:complete len:325 (+) Transcript_11451:95-1069(+)
MIIFIPNLTSPPTKKHRTVRNEHSSSCVLCGCLFCLLVFDRLLVPAPCDVRLDEEVREEEQKAEDVVKVHVDNARRRHVAAPFHQNHDCLHDHEGELDHLAHGQRRLPPNVPCVHRNEVVRVHDGVNKAVEDDGEVDVAVEVGAEVEPVEEEDGEVVVHVQEAELLPAALRDDEKRVHEVKHFRAVKHPQQLGHGGSLVGRGVAGPERVVVAAREHQGVDRHVAAQHHLNDVICERYGVHKVFTGLYGFVSFCGRCRHLHDWRADDDKGEINQGDSKGVAELCKWPVRCWTSCNAWSGPSKEIIAKLCGKGIVLSPGHYNIRYF